MPELSIIFLARSFLLIIFHAFPLPNFIPSKYLMLIIMIIPRKFTINAQYDGRTTPVRTQIAETERNGIKVRTRKTISMASTNFQLMPSDCMNCSASSSFS